MRRRARAIIHSPNTPVRMCVLADDDAYPPIDVIVNYLPPFTQCRI